MFQSIINQCFYQCVISINLVWQHFFVWNILVGAPIVDEGQCVPQHPETVQHTQHEDFSQPVPSLFHLPTFPVKLKISQQEYLSSALCSVRLGFPCSSDLQGSGCLWPRKTTPGGICCPLHFFYLPANDSWFILGGAGRGFASWTWRGETFRLLSKRDMRMQVRLRLVSASICHTDLWVWRGEDRGMMAPFPMILGHEGACVS